MTSETVNTGEPNMDTMDEEVRMDKGQGDFMIRENITLAKIRKTLLVIITWRKGNPEP